MKLILVEGIPGAGKTSACEYIREKLNNKGMDSRIYMEGDFDHPADYEAEAFIICERLRDMVNDFPELKDIDDLEYHTGMDEGVLIPYGKRLKEGKMTDRCAEELSKYDVYEMPPDLYKELILTRWKTFIQEMKTSDNIAIMDCRF
jgi:hypothetical protein